MRQLDMQSYDATVCGRFIHPKAVAAGCLFPPFPALLWHDDVFADACLASINESVSSLLRVM